MPPLVSVSKTSPLAVDGFGDAVVSLPVGATRAMPVVVAVLGIGDTPEEQCTTWQELVGARAFVVCPRGAKHMVLDEPDASEETTAATPSETDDDSETSERAKPADAGGRLRQVGYYPVDVASLDREVLASIKALKTAYGAHVAERSLVYAGFSRGAFLGASIAMKHPELFQRLVLIEGGHSPWQTDAAGAYARNGGRKILFACGQPPCVDDAQRAADVLRPQKIDVRVVHGEGEGHGYKKQVKEQLRSAFDWVVEGESSWQR